MLSVCLIGQSRVANRERDRRGAGAEKPNQPSVQGFQFVFLSIRLIISLHNFGLNNKHYILHILYGMYMYYYFSIGSTIFSENAA